MKKVLVLPPWMLSLKMHSGNAKDFDLNIGKLEENSRSADYVVGLSLGALIALVEARDIKGKIILVNPPLPKRSILRWFIQWTKYVFVEGLALEQHKLSKNPFKYIFGVMYAAKLFSIDYSDALKSAPSDKITVIRGKDDSFFCDRLTVDFLNSLHIKVVEVEGGHRWSEEAEKAVNTLIS